MPLEIAVRESGDAGLPIVIGSPTSVSAKAFFGIAKELKSRLDAINVEDAAKEKRQGALRIISS